MAAVIEYVWGIVGGVSVRVKVLGIVLGMIALIGVVVTYQMRSVLTSTLEDTLTEQGIALTIRVAQEVNRLIDADDTDSIEVYIKDRIIHYSDRVHNLSLAYIFVVGDENEPIAHTFDDSVPDELLNETGEPANNHHHYAYTPLEYNGNTVNHIAVPLADNRGTVYLGLSQSYIDTTVTSVTLQLFEVIMVMVAVGFAAAFFLTWILTRPIYDLVDMTEAVAQGDFTQRVERWADDEIGVLADAFNDMVDSLAKAEDERKEQEQLRTQYISGVIVAQENERQRIARELHDSTSQSLTSVLVGLQNLRHVENVDDHIDELRQIISGTLDEVRTISWRLRPSALDTLDLEQAMRKYIDDYKRRYNLAVDCVVTGLDDGLPSEMETTVYRIVQEGLTNIARYAQAERVSILVDKRDKRIRIVIEDNGVGFDLESVNNERKSLGLQGMRERAGLFNGQLTIETAPNKGTSLFIVMDVG